MTKLLTKLYQKSEITFAVLWIVAYVVLSSYADQLSASIGIVKSATAVLRRFFGGGHFPRAIIPSNGKG